MKLSLLMTALALPSAAASGRTSSWGTEKDFASVLADVSLGGSTEDDRAYNCDTAPPDNKCYREGYPACCADGICPEKKPPCECEGDCVPCTWMASGRVRGCGQEEFCMPFNCHTRAGRKPGTCANKPKVCTDELMPVCGCDERTYDNACEAQAAGVGVGNRGECRDRSPRRKGWGKRKPQSAEFEFEENDNSDSGKDSGLPDWEEAKKWGEETAENAKKWGEGARSNAEDWGEGAKKWAEDAGNSAKDWGEDAADKSEKEWDKIQLPANKLASKDKEPYGSDYCTWAPNYCFVEERPQCCLVKDQPCPPKQPRCDIMPPGGNYCTWSPEESCYATGWPACCSRFGGTNCPKHRPNCDVEGDDDGLKVKTLRGAMGL